MKVLKESGNYTRLGYWHDRKEVKRQSTNFDADVLKSKADTFMKAVGPYKDYEISYQCLSIDDM